MAGAVLAAPAFLACGMQAGPPAPRELGHTFESAEAAARAVLDAVARQDAARLQQLPLDEHEFRVVVWPELPSSRPEANLPLAYAWQTLRQNSQGHLARLLAEHGGRRYDLTDLRVRGESTHYPGFTVHRKPEIGVRDAAGGTHRLRLFGSLLERHGRWKVFSYVVD